MGECVLRERRHPPRHPHQINTLLLCSMRIRLEHGISDFGRAVKLCRKDVILYSTVLLNLSNADHHFIPVRVFLVRAVYKRITAPPPLQASCSKIENS